MGNLFKQPAAILFVIVVAYLCGWVRLYAYFDQFSINLLSIDVPYEHYFVWGGWVLVYLMLRLFDGEPNAVVFAVSILVLVLSVYMWTDKVPAEGAESGEAPKARSGPKYAHIRAGFGWVAAIVATIVAGLAAYDFGETAAGKLDGVKAPVQIVLEADQLSIASLQAEDEVAASQPPQPRVSTEFQRLNRTGALYLVWQDVDLTVLAAREPACVEAQGSTCPWRIYRLRTEQISLTQSPFTPEPQEQSQ
jgi:hypothetical protein